MLVNEMNREISRKFVNAHIFSKVDFFMDNIIKMVYDGYDIGVDDNMFYNYESITISDILNNPNNNKVLKEPSDLEEYINNVEQQIEINEFEIEDLEEKIETVINEIHLSSLEKELDNLKAWNNKLTEFIKEYEDYEFEDATIYEYWTINPYLYNKLKDIGEVVFDFPGCYVWGRQANGQAILLDGAIMEMALEDHKIYSSNS